MSPIFLLLNKCLCAWSGAGVLSYSKTPSQWKNWSGCSSPKMKYVFDDLNLEDEWFWPWEHHGWSPWWEHKNVVIFFWTVKLPYPAKQWSFQWKERLRWVIASAKNNMDPGGKYFIQWLSMHHWTLTGGTTIKSQHWLLLLTWGFRIQVPLKMAVVAWHDDKSMNRIDGNPYIKWGLKGSPVCASWLFQCGCHCLRCCWALHGEHPRESCLLMEDRLHSGKCAQDAMRKSVL